MKTPIKSVLLPVAVCLAMEPVWAVDGLEIRVQGSDVVLEWPSSAGEKFLITYRATYETNDSWGWLSTNWPAATGTNRTIFIHTNGADCPGGMAMMAGGGGTSGAGEPAKSSEKSGGSLPSWVSELTDYKFPKLPWDEKTQVEIARTYPGILPMLPWAEKVQEEILTAHAAEVARWEASSPGGVAMMSGGSCVPAGFYKVALEGIHLPGVTDGYVISGVFQWPVELGTTSSNVTGAAVFLNGFEFPGSTVERRSDGSMWATLNTALVGNGNYQLHLMANNDFGLPPILGRTNSVTITNLMSFDEFATTFGSKLWVLALINNGGQPVDFEVRIQNTDGAPIQSLFGTTSDGLINGTWDLSSTNGPVTNTTLVGNFYFGSPGGALNNFGGQIMWYREPDWSGDDFVVARAENVVLGVEEDYHPSVYEIVNTLGAPFGDEYELSPGNLPLGGITFQFTSDTKEDLLTYLEDSASGNFFWWGHGNPNQIGYGHIAGYDGNGVPIFTNRVFITPSQVALRLGNNGLVANHPYRHVFLHGCSTAGQSSWSRAFGIEPISVSVSDYETKGTRARAFVGPDTLFGVPGPGDQLPYAESLVEFYARWMSDYTISQCLNAALAPPGPGETRVALDTNAVWRIYGAVNLRRSSP